MGAEPLRRKGLNMSRFLAFAAVALVTANTADAQQNCGPRDQVIEHLAEAFGEARQSIGLAQDNHVVETFAALDSGTWTIVITLPSGVTCLVASGTGFERLDETPRPTGTAS